MFFLLRVAFWLTVVLVLLPSGGSQQNAKAKASVGATDAVIAASAAVSDMSGFCERQPEACEVGAQAASVIGQRAQAGARMVYDFVSERASRSGDNNTEKTADKSGEKNSETGSVTKPHPKLAATVRTVAASQDTLKDTDLEPAWQAPLQPAQNVPLPRKAPFRKV